MRILLDECLPRKLAGLLSFPNVSTVPREGCAGIKNGRLLTLASEKFDVFLTVDENIPKQLNIRKYRIGLVILRVPSNRLEDIQPLLPEIENTIREVEPHSHIILRHR